MSSHEIFFPWRIIRSGSPGMTPHALIVASSSGRLRQCPFRNNCMWQEHQNAPLRCFSGTATPNPLSSVSIDHSIIPICIMISSSGSIMTPLFRIKSCWSLAGIGTSIVIEYKTGPCIVMDLGATPNYADSLRASVVLLTHGHLDHMGAIFSHARAYALQHSGQSATYYMPVDLVPLLERAKACMEALDAENDGSLSLSTSSTAGSSQRNESGLPMTFVGVRPGDALDLPIKKNLNGETIFVRVFKTFHRGAPSVGYVVGVRQRPTLKNEYKGMTSQRLRELAMSKVSIVESIDCFEVAYTGDTTIETFRPYLQEGHSSDDLDKSALHLEQAFQCHFFITESTILDSNKESRCKAHDMGHMHLLDIVDAVVPRVQHHLVLLHISSRYDADTALQLIAASISPRTPCLVAVASLHRVGSEVDPLLSENGLLLLSAYRQYGKLTTRTEN